jgi:hypothetical protein
MKKILGKKIRIIESTKDNNFLNRLTWILDSCRPFYLKNKDTLC